MGLATPPPEGDIVSSANRTRGPSFLSFVDRDPRVSLCFPPTFPPHPEDDDRIDGALAFVVNDAGVKTQCGEPLVTSGAGSTTGGGRIRIVCPPGAGTSVKVRVEMPGAQNQPLQMAEIEAYGAPQAWSSSWGDMKATMTKMTQDMKDVPSDLAKANSNFDAQSTLIASLRSDRDSQSTLIATQSVIMNEQSTLIAELSTTLQQLKAPIRRADPQQSPEQPAIAPEVGSDDNGLTLRATSGDVSFESSECEQTNLCDLARDVAGIVAKFSSP